MGECIYCSDKLEKGVSCGYCKKCVSNFEEHRIKYCVRCKTLRSLEMFRNCEIGFMLKFAQCKICQHTDSLNLDFQLNSLLRAAKNRCSERIFKNMRLEVSEYDLNLNFMKEMWNLQSGICSYSGIYMNINPHSDFKFSLERINNDRGYTMNNVTFIIGELNTSKKWNKEKIRVITTFLIYENPSLNEIDTRNKDFPIRRKAQCRTCDSMIFYKIGYCRSCYKVNSIAEILRNIKNSCARRNRKDFPTLRPPTLNDLWNQLQSQRGKCFYSDMNMTFNGRRDDWNISIERLDTTKGYEVGNFVFICEEFNSPDRSSIKTLYEKQGSCGWSRDKFIYFKLCALEYNNYYK